MSDGVTAEERYDLIYPVIRREHCLHDEEVVKEWHTRRDFMSRKVSQLPDDEVISNDLGYAVRKFKRRKGRRKRMTKLTLVTEFWLFRKELKRLMKRTVTETGQKGDEEKCIIKSTQWKVYRT